MSARPSSLLVQSSSHKVSHTCLLDAADVPAVLRMARAALGWSQRDFALVAGLNKRTIVDLEASKSDPKLTTLKCEAAVFKHHGIEVWSDPSGRIGVTCAEGERRKVVAMPGRQRVFGL